MASLFSLVWLVLHVPTTVLMISPPCSIGSWTFPLDIFLRKGSLSYQKSWALLECHLSDQNVPRPLLIVLCADPYRFELRWVLQHARSIRSDRAWIVLGPIAILELVCGRFGYVYVALGANKLDQVQATSDPGQPSMKKVPKVHRGPQSTNVKSTCIKTLQAYKLRDTRSTWYISIAKVLLYTGSKINHASPDVESSVSLALGFSPIPAPSKSDSGFLQKQHATPELDSGQLPSSRMQNPNRQTNRAVYRLDPRTSGLELRPDPRPDARTDRTEACLSRPTRQAKTDGQVRTNLAGANSDSDHGFSLLARLARTACTDDRADDLSTLFNPIKEFSFGYFSKATILKLSEDLGFVGTQLVRSKRPAALADRPAYVLILTALDLAGSDALDRSRTVTLTSFLSLFPCID
ncbi:hypothetical protein DY000_02031183 [Brassica cretica]|uniref:Uncharacterized protein n=1 Tax=Brassica cretica TaxID=69181 RepID=A0ABQ7E0L8_BRACR|nr:hypothetical protein DY000_02031183 [Brassica cretica]